MKDYVPLRTRWAQRLRDRQRPQPGDLREHLLEVHRRNAGFTEACAWASRDARGRNSYEWLAELIEPERHGTVLDLACGSGPLSALCHERFGSRVRLIGVDMSEHELALARQRLPADSVRWHQGLAQELHFLEDASVDVVLCHWALTLMDPVEPVLAEVWRVLKPGGVFGAIVDGDRGAAPEYERLHDVIYDLARAEYPFYGEVDLGDARVRTAAALAALVATRFDGVVPRVEPGVVHLNGSPAALARQSAGFFYASFVLSPASHARMLKALEGIFAESARSGEGRFSMPINRLAVEKAAACVPAAAG